MLGDPKPTMDNSISSINRTGAISRGRPTVMKWSSVDVADIRQYNGVSSLQHHHPENDDDDEIFDSSNKHDLVVAGWSSDTNLCSNGDDNGCRSLVKATVGGRRERLATLLFDIYDGNRDSRCWTSSVGERYSGDNESLTDHSLLSDGSTPFPYRLSMDTIGTLG